ncbi:protein ROLLING AND ERECT LEAF 2-like [Typha latifolia]|uniref:protein ROLLING AND ERECT LEAF 2-like n=1 Tax=Typha latifolia TaxID=4733 RepID=UPI003C2CF0CF
MGCSASRLEDEEVVQLCRDRRNFIKEAIEQRIRFASGHVAYIQSLRRVSMALRKFVGGDEQHDFLLDSYSSPYTPAKRLSPEILGIPLKSFSPTPDQFERRTIHVAKYLRSGPSPSVSVEEWPQPTETVRIDSYYSADHYEIDGIFATQASPASMPTFSTPYDRPNYPPPSPQNSQWDFFWNPFSSLDNYGYPYRRSFDRIINDDDIAGLRQVREEEGIPDLEEEGSQEEEDYINADIRNDGSKFEARTTTRASNADEGPSKVTLETNTTQEAKEFQSISANSVEVLSQPHNAAAVLEVKKEKNVVGNKEGGEETPGFTAYLNRKLTSMTEVMKDIDDQFTRICECAHEVSVMLEASRAQYSSTSNELAVKMLNPVAMLRSASSRSLSSRFFHSSSSSRDEGYESSSDYSEDSCMLSGSHQSTLDRLYAWEKKLYEEVKAGERIRIAYEKKLMQLRSQDVNGEEPYALDKTRTAIRDLHTRLKVSIHSVQSVSKRIEILRDEELHPQLMELIQGLARMWRTMAECHRIQKRTIDDAKTLVFSLLSSDAATQPVSPHSAAALESALRGWRAALAVSLSAQRSYARALAGWARRCSGGGGSASPVGGAPPAFATCAEWSRLLDSVSEARVMDGLDLFAAGIGSACGGEDPAETIAEVDATMAARVMVAGMSVAVSSLAEFAANSAEGYDELVKSGRGDGGAES